MDRLVLIGSRCVKSPQLREAAKKFEESHELCFSETGVEYTGSEDNDSVMVYDNFEDPVFAKLSSTSCIIVSPLIMLDAVNTTPPEIPRYRRPLYNRSMKDVVVCFTGFNDKTHVSKLVTLVHFMNGAIRKEISSSVTHVVANSTRGSKYISAVNLGIPIMQDDWIMYLWSKRDESTFTAQTPELMKYKASPFLRCGLVFHGFNEKDLREMEDIAISNGAHLSILDDSESTHLVCDDVQTLPDSIRSAVYVVTAEWFWASVQIEACADEKLYQVDQNKDQENGGSRLTPGRRHTPSRSKKRKRYLRENLAALASEGEGSSYKNRRSSTDQLSISRASCDYTPDSSGCILDSPVSQNITKQVKSPSPEKSAAPAKQSARRLVVGELLQTEINYCTILNNILQIFRDGAVKADQPGGPILSQTDAKIIFDKIPPILEIHKDIKGELEMILVNWTEDIPIAGLILKRVEKLRQAYPPFVNYMDKTKDKISECMRTNHRFHAFMKVCERSRECGRQGLPDLMMNIVQRLPRIELLLQQIHKYTEKRTADSLRLEEAQSGLKSVMTYINEDKRLTDERMVLFDIVHDIDNCPPNLLSASRSLVHRLDCDEVSDELIARGEHLTMFLFSDCLEIVKRRHSKQNFAAKSPGAPRRSTVPTRGSSKPFKHVEFLTLQSIKRIINLTIGYELEGGFSDCSSPMFSLVCRQVTDSREKLYTFQIMDLDTVDKITFITALARHVANISCRIDYETLITLQPAEDFMITALDNTSHKDKTMTRAVSKFGRKLGRKMTMKGISSPLKRAVSTIITPTRHSSFSSRHPSSDMSSMSVAGSMYDLDQTGTPSGRNLEPIQAHDSSKLQSCTALPRNTSTMSLAGPGTPQNTGRRVTITTKRLL